MRRRLVRWQFHVNTTCEVVSSRKEIFLLDPSSYTISVALHPKCSCCNESAEYDHEPNCRSESLHE
jgi:hypothetical protein